MRTATAHDAIAVATAKLSGHTVVSASVPRVVVGWDCSRHKVVQLTDVDILEIPS